jgi:hypothetical protein
MPFMANLDDSYQILTFGSSSGRFANLNLPDIGPDFVFDPVYDSTSLSLVVSSA